MLAVLQQLVIPDPWQSEAVTALRGGASVVVDAPTGSGKTLVFERLVEQGNLKAPAFYTVPTRALANDKFAEWRARGWRCGILTGDLSLDPDAPVVVATLEALLGRIGPGFRASVAVVDEYQWLADPVRGPHYEAFVMTLPAEVPLLFLSGCVANPEDAAGWLQRLGRTVRVVRHAQRPVPLEEADLQELEQRAPREVTGFWSRRIAGALREDLGPVLLFAPHRQEAARLARQLARELPPCPPVGLTDAQSRLAGPELAKLLEARVAAHHSGLDYAVRAGLIEPLAKAGQLRVVVATLGLSAGINFSLRSVVITRTRYQFEGLDRDILPHELLQMMGRAGRRGLDETGYLLVGEDTPRMADARPVRLRRAQALPWAPLLRADDGPGAAACARYAVSLFQPEPLSVGAESTRRLDPATVPCGQATDTGRARLARRVRRAFPACATCTHLAECRELDPSPTLLWHWQRLRVLDYQLHLTERGRLVREFLGPEGLAIAAAVEDPEYDPEELLFDCANLFAGDRFSRDESRWAGRLAASCRTAYRDFNIDGWLVYGVPPQYGNGASERLQGLMLGDRRRAQVADETATVGDVNRLLVEWRSLLRQLAALPEFEGAWNARRAALRDAARKWLDRLGPTRALPELPPLTPAQRTPMAHHRMTR